MRAGNNILVVEDGADTRNAMRSLLEAEGYRVTCAANGREALDCLHSSQLPCVILLDLHMPVMDGLQFSQELQRDPELALIATVIISAAENLTQVAASLGATDYCSKPIRFDWLLKTIHRLCAGKGRPERNCEP
jgi:CheY-like chemotaxis protein